MWYSHVDAELWIRLSRIDVKDICQDSTTGQVEASNKKAGQHNSILRFQEQKCGQCWRRMRIMIFFLNFASKRSQFSGECNFIWIKRMEMDGGLSRISSKKYEHAHWGRKHSDF